MTYYNVTALADNVSGIDSMITMTNSMTEGTFGMLFLCALWVIIFMALYQKSGDVNKAIATTSFIIFVLTNIAWALGWVTGLMLWVMLALLAAGMCFVWKSR